MTILTTFNTGLFHGLIEGATARREKLIEALIELEADVVCLQEVWPKEVATGWSASEIEAIIAAVEAVYPHHFAGLEPFRDEGYVSGGHHGLLTLSRHPFEIATLHQLPSTLVRRGVLHTRISVPGLGKIDVFNTHLAADLSHILPYPGGAFSSFGEEQAAQMELLLEMADTLSTSKKVMLLGDFNAGPEAEGVAAEWPENYQKLIRAGFYDAAVDGVPVPLVTYAAENTLTETSVDRILDHILLRFDEERPQVERIWRIWDQPMVLSDAGRLIHLSDHYGLALSLE